MAAEGGRPMVMDSRIGSLEAGLGLSHNVSHETDLSGDDANLHTSGMPFGPSAREIQGLDTFTQAFLCCTSCVSLHVTVLHGWSSTYFNFSWFSIYQ